MAGKKKTEKKTEKKTDKVEISASEYEELKKASLERDEYHDKWLKVHAEYENTRKRMEKEKFNHMQFANENIITQLFSIVDNFDMALASMNTAKDKAAVMDGIVLVQKEFHRILEDNGVKRIKTDKEQFDPNVHEAILGVETDEYADGEIIAEVRAGYKLNDRLLRPSQVKVAKSIKAA